MKFTTLQSLKAFKLASFKGTHADGICVCGVFGFDTSGFSLNSHHRALLAFTIPMLNTPASLLEMYGRTDRSGSDSFNMVLSRRRLRATQDALISLGAPHEKVFSDLSKPLGENFETFFGQADGTRSPGGRAVWAFFWPSKAAFEEGPDEDENASIRSLVMFGRNFTPG